MNVSDYATDACPCRTHPDADKYDNAIHLRGVAKRCQTGG